MNVIPELIPTRHMLDVLIVLIIIIGGLCHFKNLIFDLLAYPRLFRWLQIVKHYLLIVPM